MHEMVVKHYASGEVLRLLMNDGLIGRIHAEDSSLETKLVLAPQLVDLQINGRAGIDFLDPNLSPERVAEFARGLADDGVGAALATVTTQSFDRITKGLSTILAACQQDAATARRIVGVHLEGPYLSPLDGPRGAHPLAEIRPPSIEEFSKWQELAGGLIRLVTVSPEHPGTAAFIRTLVKQGIVVSLGHLSATKEQIAEAVDAGASMSTHLGNGAHGQLPRHPNYLWTQLAEDRLTASIIADGHHLPDDVLRCFVRCKGVERIVAVSDMTGLGGMPPGRYDQTPLGAVEVLDDGKLVVAGQRQFLAGAALPLWRAIEKLTRATDLSLAQAIDACSVRPARLIGVDCALRLEPGQLSAIVLEQNGAEIRLVAVIESGVMKRVAA